MSWDTDYPDPLLDLQDQIRDRLESRPFFASISVLSERPKTIGGKVDKLVTKFEGIYAAVLTVEGRATDDYLKGPESQVSVDVSACELTKTNRVGTGYVTATRVLTQIIRALHSYKPAISTEKLRYQGFRVDDADQSTGVLILTARFNAVIRFPADLS